MTSVFSGSLYSAMRASYSNGFEPCGSLHVNFHHDVRIRNGSRSWLAALDLVDVLHARDDLAPDRVLPGQALASGIVEADKELAVRRVGVGCACRADGAALEGLIRQLGRKIGQFRAACARACRIAGLRHEAVDHAVPFNAVVETLARKRLDARDVLRRQVGSELNDDLATLQIDDELVARGMCRLAGDEGGSKYGGEH